MTFAKELGVIEIGSGKPQKLLKVQNTKHNLVFTYKMELFILPLKSFTILYLNRLCLHHNQWFYYYDYECPNLVHVSCPFFCNFGQKYSWAFKITVLIDPNNIINTIVFVQLISDTCISCGNNDEWQERMIDILHHVHILIQADWK